MAGESPFTLLVSLVGERPVRYTFDQPAVLVGRGPDADLRIEHAGISRRQLLIERGVGSAGEARFRITPYESTNPTLVNDRPAVEGTLMPGDLVAVAEVRLSLERVVPPRAAAKSRDLSVRTMVLLAAVMGMGLLVAYLFYGVDEAPDAGDLAANQTRLFEAMPQVHCGNPIECDTRAHDAYGRGRKLLSQAAADPGNLYRAALELDKAARFREQSGRPLGDMADVEEQAQQARSRAEAEFQDAKFRLSRAIAAEDPRRCAEEAAGLARIVPDARHPYRIKLDAYRRLLPREGTNG
jgi:hypothetical protein